MNSSRVLDLRKGLMIKDHTDERSIPEALADETTQRMMAKARKRTRASLAKKFRVTKETVRRWEKRADLYLTTLRKYAQRKGGNLWLEVTMPDRPPVILSGLGEDQGEKRAKKRAGNGVKSKPKTRRAA